MYVCGRFMEGVALAERAQQGRPIAFFVQARPTAYMNVIWKARDQGKAWATLPLGTWAPTVALLWPEHLAVALLSWIDRTMFPPKWRADDEIVGRFLHEQNAPIMATVPSLVEHPDTEPSVMNGHKRVGNGLDPARRAYFYIGDDPEYQCDATRIDWSAG